MSIWDCFAKLQGQHTAPASLGVSFLIAGLGNPGVQYEKTRHNAGFRALDALAASLNCQINRAKFSALVGRAEIGGKGVLLMKPQTYMNCSGDAVAQAARYYTLSAEQILILSDDVHLDIGRMRLRHGGSDGGQKGLRSVAERLGTQSYLRLRIGVGQKPDQAYPMAEYVLGKMTQQELDATAARYQDLIRGCELVVSGSFDAAVAIVNAGDRA